MKVSSLSSVLALSLLTLCFVPMACSTGPTDTEQPGEESPKKPPCSFADLDGVDDFELAELCQGDLKGERALVALLGEAVAKGDEAMVARLFGIIDFPARVLAAPESGFTDGSMVCFALKQRQYDILASVAAKAEALGADLSQVKACPTREGPLSPLHLAVEQRANKPIRSLIAGKSPQEVRRGEYPALHRALLYANTQEMGLELVNSFLVSPNANLVLVDSQDRTILHHARMLKFFDVEKAVQGELLRRGLDLRDRMDAFGKLAADYPSGSNQSRRTCKEPDLAKLLKAQRDESSKDVLKAEIEDRKTCTAFYGNLNPEFLNQWKSAFVAGEGETLKKTIKDTFHANSKKCHPDKCKTPECATQFLELSRCHGFFETYLGTHLGKSCSN